MTAKEYIRVIGTEFEDVKEGTIEIFIDMCKPHISKEKFGQFYEQALAQFVCHKMKMAGYGENSLGELGKVANQFVVSSISDGGTSLSFAGGGDVSADAEFTKTIYGMQYIQIRRQCVVPIGVG